MKTRFLLLALGVLLAGGAEAQAQTRQRPTDRPEVLRARRDAMVQNRDAIRHRREALRQRFENMPAEQRAFLEGLRAERREVLGQVKIGALTRQEAREAIRAWVQANRPSRPGR